MLGRLDAEVVALQEIASSADAGYLRTLAKQLGYPYVEIAPGGPFGGLRNALLSDFPITRSTLWTSALLSGATCWPGCRLTSSPAASTATRSAAPWKG